MRIGILSDLHEDGYHRRLLLEKMGKLDSLLFLGDMTRDADDLYAYSLAQEPFIPFWSVRGNNNFTSTEPDELTVEIGGKRIFMTHGHLYGVRIGVQNLVARAKQAGADVALYGHTHIPFCDYVDNILVINPGPGGSYGYEGKHMGCVILIENGKMRVETVQV